MIEYNASVSVADANARVAQWWSVALPRRRSRVRSPSRALFICQRKPVKRVSVFLQNLIIIISHNLRFAGAITGGYMRAAKTVVRSGKIRKYIQIRLIYIPDMYIMLLTRLNLLL